MSLETTLNKIVARRQHDAPTDLIDRLDRYKYEFDGAAVSMIRLGGAVPPMLMHDLALRHVAGRLGIPFDYLRRCPAPLADLNLNYWAQTGSHKQAALLRTIRGNQVRAVLGQSYAPFDDIDVFPIIADALAGEEVRVQSMDFGDSHTHVRILFPRIMTEARPGDIVQGGIHVSNSEVGLRAVQIESIAYRLICTNGLVSPYRLARVSARHIGNPERIRDFVSLAVREAKEGTHHLIKQFKESVHRRIDEPLKAIERTAAEGGLSQEQYQRILTSFLAEGSDDTLYGVINAFTHAAQAEPNFEARYQLERVGSGLLRAA